ncbi:MAG: hypothetical protein KatS3mg087_1511 [Patescibacteria group bacterium]|nr:MAG: hypothetical protein KatS3mg087_1511 [Patescibacteria group bacterium]
MIIIKIPHQCKITGETCLVKIRAKKWLDFEVVDSPCKPMGELFFKMCDCYKAFQPPNPPAAMKVLAVLQTHPSRTASKILAAAAQEKDINIASDALLYIAERGIKHKELIRALYKRLRDESEDIRLLAKTAIEKIHAVDIEEIKKLFKQKNLYSKMGAMLLIEAAQEDEALDIIRDGINDRYHDVRKLAISALVEIKNEKKYEIIKHYLQSTDKSLITANFFLKELCICLASIEITEDILDEIEKIILTHTSEQVKIAACMALSKTKNERTIKLLIDILKSEETSSHLKETASQILGILQAEESIDILINIANSPNISTHLFNTAFCALCNIKHPKVYEFMKQHPHNSIATAYINKYK